MKLWMMLAIGAAGFVGTFSVLKHKQGVEEAAQVERQRVHQEYVWKVEDEKRTEEHQAYLEKIRADGKASIAAARQEALERMKSIVDPVDYPAFKREREKDWAEQDAKELQEEQLQELREIKEKLGK